MNQTEEESKIIYSFPRGENEKIQLALRPYKGRYYIDLRLWFQNAPESPLTPTKKGVSFSSDSIADLKEGVRQLDLACAALKQPAENPKTDTRPRAQQGAYTRRPSSSWTQRSGG